MPLSESQEKLIIERILAGDREQFAQLINEHNRRIFQFIWRHLRDAELASELTHESFVRAFRNLKQYRGEVRFIFWLERIALNVLRSFTTSKRGREMRLWESLDEVPVIADKMRLPDEQAADRELLRKVRRHLGAIPQRYAEVVHLSVFEDRSAEEVAAILEVPVGTVLSRLHRGLKQLLKKMEREKGDE